MENPNQQLVVVDDQPTAREPLERYGKLLGWRVVTTDGSTQPKGLDATAPILVLLDFALGGRQPSDWLKAFRAHYPDARVYVLTGHAEDQHAEIAKFCKQNNPAGVLQKPFRLDRLPGLAEVAPTSAQVTDSADDQRMTRQQDPKVLIEAAYHLEPAIHILRADTLDRVYGNRKALERGERPADAMVQKMATELRERADEPRVARTDWEPKKGKFLRRRLYRAGPWYWLAEDWKTEAEDAEMVRLMLPKEPDDQLAVLADIFEQHWGITRVRFYRASCLAGMDDAPGNLNERYLLRPQWQRGDGFEGGNAVWERFEFRIKQSVQAEQAFDTPARRWLISDVHDRYAASKHGCLPIAWGNAETRVEIPIWNEREEPIALLAIDRRSDHLPTAQVQDAVPSTRIDEQQMESMQGYLEAIRPVLEHIVDKRRQARKAKWREKLQTVIADAMAEADARQAFCAVCDSVLGFWDALGAPLADMVLLLRRPERLVDVWAGSGPCWQRLRDANHQFEVAGFLEGVPSPYRVIHDLEDAWAALTGAAQRALRPLLAPESGTAPQGSLLVIPFKEGKHTTEALLLVRTGRVFVFSQSRADALIYAANALHGLLRWGLAQAQTEWVTRALAHEFLEPMDALEHSLSALADGPRAEAANRLRLLRTVIENLRYLARPERAEGELSTDVEFGVLLADLSGLLKPLHPHVRLAWSEAPLTMHVAESSLQQILFNLLDNACKYAETPDGAAPQVDVRWRAVDGGLAIRVTNPVIDPINEETARRIWQPYVRGNAGTTARGAGIGLTVVSLLCAARAWQCELSNRGEGTPGNVAFDLVLPHP